MGVSHLTRDAAAASGHDSTSSTGASYGRPASNSGTTSLPGGSGKSFSEKSLHTGVHPAQPPKGNANGGRGGSKSGQPTIGSRSGNSRPMSGGRMG